MVLKGFCKGTNFRDLRLWLGLQWRWQRGPKDTTVTGDSSKPWEGFVSSPVLTRQWGCRVRWRLAAEGYAPTLSPPNSNSLFLVYELSRRLEARIPMWRLASKGRAGQGKQRMDLGWHRKITNPFLSFHILKKKRLVEMTAYPELLEILIKGIMCELDY